MLFRSIPIIAFLSFPWIPTIASATQGQLPYSISSQRDTTAFRKRTCPHPPFMCRGGSIETDHKYQTDEPLAQSVDAPVSYDSLKEIGPSIISERSRSRLIKVRHTPDIIGMLVDKHNIHDESYELRQMITARAQEYLDELASVSDGDKIPDPLRVLHSVGPKIPAIKHSPNFMLRITSATSDVDAGAAACTIGMIARLCELYDKKASNERQNMKSTGSVVIKDRRFEQLVECVMCGVDVKKRKREALEMRISETTLESEDIESVLDGEDNKVDEGLTVVDACRAAWGLSMLGGYNLDSFGGEKAQDILIALSLRIRELLLARLQRLRLGEVEADNTQKLSLNERFDRGAEALAQDAVAAMWTFSCVKACTGLKSFHLFETCCSVLCQNPTDLRLRAQANKIGFDDSDFEVNDVVERLARSERETKENTPMNTVMSEDTDSYVAYDERNTLIDMLSPNEVTDAIWSLALHGSTNDVRLLHYKTLSETAATFREVAFDRILEWLQDDFYRLQQHPSSEQTSDTDNYNGLSTPTWEQGEDSISFEVVDASVIIAMEQSGVSGSTTVESMEIKNSPIKSGDSENIENLEAIKAAPLPATLDEVKYPEIVVDFPKLGYLESRKLDLIFTTHNLCAIVWAATDLNDSLQGKIVDLVVDIFMTREHERSSGLVGGDLANLAWAIARRAAMGREEGNSFNSTSCVTTTDWIAQEILELVASDSTDYNNAMLLHQFQPPEIGRLMWSIAWTMTVLLDPSTTPSPQASSLAALCLRVAASNLPVFGTEDLARVAWAFLVLYHRDDNVMDPTLAEPLGRILSILETSLLRWESGKSGPVSSTDRSHVEDSVRFASFLGRPRTSSPVPLDQRVGEFDIDDDVLPAVAEKDSLPLLRDLSTDPATLCKLASGLAKFAANHPEIKGGWTIARIAVRLLVSRDGSLMKETSMKDIIRLCVACASNKIPGYGRETVTRLYARKVVQLLNDILHANNENDHDVSSLLDISPWDLSNLVWSLGELGIHHEKYDENRLSAHRKHYLITDKTLLSDDNIATLSTTSLARFLIGILAMDFLSSKPSFIVQVLKELQSRELTSLPHPELCHLVESLAKLRINVQDSDNDAVHETINPNSSEEDTNELVQGNSPCEDITEETVIASLSEIQIIRQHIFSCTKKILDSAIQHAAGCVVELSPEQLRRLMLFVVMTPIDAGVLVDAVEEEIMTRSADQSHQMSLEHLLCTSADTSIRSMSVLSGTATDNESTLSALKSSLKSLFFSSEHSSSSSEPPSENSSQQLEEVRNLLNETVTQSIDVSNRLRAVARRSGKGIDNILDLIEEGANFELGRCKELIAAYRRIDFVSGTRQSRYDKERRKYIGKRLLSRRFH